MFIRYLMLSVFIFMVPAVFSQVPEPNPLDRFLQSGKTKKMVINTVDDRQFLRRAWLDLTGRLPDLQTTEAFAANPSVHKRKAIIEQLLATEAYTHRWTHFFGDLFGIFNIRNGELRDPFHFLIQDMIARDLGWDEMAVEILTNNQPASSMRSSVFLFARERLLEMSTFLDVLDDSAADISEIMLGVNTLCISCHDGAYHLEDINKGLSVMTRRDFWGFAAFLAKAHPRRPPREDLPDYSHWWTTFRVMDSDDPNITIDPNLYDLYETDWEEYYASSIYGRPPRTGGLILPSYPFTGETPRPGETRRQALARMITADRQFARNMVNRVWAHFFGRGFVEPLDGWDLGRLDEETAASFGTTVQAETPALMEWLTSWFIEHDYNLRELMGLIANSALYQWDYRAETRTNGWVDNRRVRRLEAQSIVDGVFHFLGLKYKLLVSNHPDTSYISTWRMPGHYEPSWYAWYSFEDDSRRHPYQRLGYESEEQYDRVHRMVRDMLMVLGSADRSERARPKAQSSISTNLALLNEETLHAWLESGEKAPLITRLTDEMRNGKSKASVVRELFLSALFREPTQVEMEASTAHFTGRSRDRALRDLVWAMLNHPDFLYK